MGGVGVLGDAGAAPMGKQILRQVEPLLCVKVSVAAGFGGGELVGMELIDGVEGKNLGYQ